MTSVDLSIFNYQDDARSNKHKLYICWNLMVFNGRCTRNILLYHTQAYVWTRPWQKTLTHETWRTHSVNYKMSWKIDGLKEKGWTLPIPLIHILLGRTATKTPFQSLVFDANTPVITFIDRNCQYVRYTN